VGFDDSEVEVLGRDEVDGATRQRGAALVQLASVDGRGTRARYGRQLHRRGRLPVRRGLLLPQPDAAPEKTAAVTEELRRIVAGCGWRARTNPANIPPSLVSKQLAAIAGSAQTLEGIAKAGVLLAQQFTQRGAVIVLQGIGPASDTLRVVAVSTRRITGCRGSYCVPPRRRSGPSRPGAGGVAPARTTCSQCAPRPPASGSAHRLSAVRRPLRDRSPGGDGSPASPRHTRRPPAAAPRAELGPVCPLSAVFEAERAVSRPAHRSRTDASSSAADPAWEQAPIATLIYAGRSITVKELNDSLGSWGPITTRAPITKWPSNSG